MSTIRVERLGANHDRRGFSCGSPALDRYFWEQAGQDARRRVAAPFVASDDGTRVLGFYTLAATSICITDMPVELTKKLPRYPRLPATLLGRLATSIPARGVGLGRFLLIDALNRMLESQIASFAIVVDAKDETAAAFYERESFIRMPSDTSRLVRRADDIALALARP